MTDDPELPAWHQALAYAVTGQRLEDLGRQAFPDASALAEVLRGRRLTVSPASPSVPPDLMHGLGPAQFLAALAQLRSALAPVAAAPVLADRPLTPDERRLLTDVPPHHGV